ncbi:MAG: tetratricopeptide repeat protein [Pseudomonadota bacterium]
MALPLTCKTVPFRMTLQKAASALALAFGLAACASGGQNLDVANEGENLDYENSIEVYSDPAADPNGLDPVAAAAFWGSVYDRDPKNWEAAVKYSAALRKIGSIDQAVNVMVNVNNRNGEEPLVDFETGKALIEAGRAFEAVRYLEEAAAALPSDWKVMSAYGVALDQIGEHQAARAKYDYALSLNPKSVQILNNKGLSYALEGNLAEAVHVLRTAVSTPGADARIRQNLALALAIKGDLFQAERLARSDLPPQIANQNIDYFRSLVVQPAYWQDYANNSVETPEFAPAPLTQSDVPAQPTQTQNDQTLPVLLQETPTPQVKPAEPAAPAERAIGVTNASAPGPYTAQQPSAQSAPVEENDAEELARKLDELLSDKTGEDESEGVETEADADVSEETGADDDADGAELKPSDD